MGHREIDTVHGRSSNHAIATQLEHKTGKLTDKSTTALNKKVIKLIGRDPCDFKTITADNGADFYQL